MARIRSPISRWLISPLLSSSKESNTALITGRADSDPRSSMVFSSSTDALLAALSLATCRIARPIPHSTLRQNASAPHAEHHGRIDDERDRNTHHLVNVTTRLRPARALQVVYVDGRHQGEHQDDELTDAEDIRPNEVGERAEDLLGRVGLQHDDDHGGNEGPNASPEEWRDLRVDSQDTRAAKYGNFNLASAEALKGGDDGRPVRRMKPPIRDLVPVVAHRQCGR
eukprot:5369522-Prymnesium_polylepis.3